MLELATRTAGQRTAESAPATMNTTMLKNKRLKASSAFQATYRYHLASMRVIALPATLQSRRLLFLGLIMGRDASSPGFCMREPIQSRIRVDGAMGSDSLRRARSELPLLACCRDWNAWRLLGAGWAGILGPSRLANS